MFARPRAAKPAQNCNGFSCGFCLLRTCSLPSNYSLLHLYPHRILHVLCSLSRPVWVQITGRRCAFWALGSILAEPSLVQALPSIADDCRWYCTTDTWKQGSCAILQENKRLEPHSLTTHLQFDPVIMLQLLQYIFTSFVTDVFAALARQSTRYKMYTSVLVERVTKDSEPIHNCNHTHTCNYMHTLHYILSRSWRVM